MKIANIGQMIDTMKNGLIVDSEGRRHWYKDDKRHRLDGPALEYPPPRPGKYWYVNNELLGGGDEGFWALWDLLSEEQRCNLELHFHLPNLTL